MKTRIAVLASGRGSGFKAIVEAVRAQRLDAEIVALVCDRAGAPVLSLAREAGIRAVHVPVPEALGERRRLHEEKILAELGSPRPHFLVLAGYMRVLTPHLIEAFRSERGYSRIVNIHPSLLPSFPGVGSYVQAFRHGVKVTGATVHLVENEVDSGPICAQEAFAIQDCATSEEVEARGLQVEHRLYPEALSWIIPEKFEFEIAPRNPTPHAGPGGRVIAPALAPIGGPAPAPAEPSGEKPCL